MNLHQTLLLSLTATAVLPACGDGASHVPAEDPGFGTPIAAIGEELSASDFGDRKSVV